MRRATKPGEYVAVSSVDQDGPSAYRHTHGAQREPRHYKPTATKTPALALFLGALLLCIILLEVLLHQGTKFTPLQPWQDPQSHQATKARRQDASVVQSSTAVDSASGTVQNSVAVDTPTMPASTASVDPPTTPSSTVNVNTPTTPVSSVNVDTPTTPSSTVNVDPPAAPASTTIDGDGDSTSPITGTIAETSQLTFTDQDGEMPTLTAASDMTLTTPSTIHATFTVPGTAELSLTSSSTAKETLSPSKEMSLTTPVMVSSTSASPGRVTISRPPGETLHTNTGADLTLTTPSNVADKGASSSLQLGSISVVSTTATQTAGAGLTLTSKSVVQLAGPKSTASLSMQSSQPIDKPISQSVQKTSSPSQSFGKASSTSEGVHVTSLGSLLSLTTAASSHHASHVEGSVASLAAATSSNHPSHSGGSILSSAALTSTHRSSHSADTQETFTQAPESDLSLTSPRPLEGTISTQTLRMAASNHGDKTTSLDQLSSEPSHGHNVVHETPGPSSQSQISGLPAQATHIEPSHTRSGSSFGMPPAMTGSVKENYATESTYIVTTTDKSGKTTSYYVVVVASSDPAPLEAVTTSFETNGIGTAAPSPSSQMTLTISSAAPATTASSTESKNPFTQSELKLEGPFTKIDYFNAMYLGPFVAVFLKVLYDSIYAATKLMEPFYQLAKPGGAIPADSLVSDYLSTGLSWDAFRSMLRGRWMIILSTIMYLLIGLLPALAAESMTVKAQAYCATELSPHQKCDPAWVLTSLTMRFLEGVLGVLALLFMVVIIYNRRRKSGVFSNPSSIASMSALLSHRGVIEDLQRIDPEADLDTIARALSGNHYALGYHVTSSGLVRYGIIKFSPSLSPRFSQSSEYSALSNPANKSLPSKQRSNFWDRLIDFVFILAIFALLGVVLAYYLDGKSDPFNNFFNSDTFGPRFTLTISATLLDTQWKRLEREVRIMAPYRRMKKRWAKPDNTILLPMNGTPLTSLPIALWHGYLFHALVAFVAILSDVNIIAVAGIPYSEAQIRPMLLASCYTSFGILGLMVVTMIGILLWRLDNPRMPRPPDTVASVCAYLCASRILEDFQRMEKVGAELRDATVKESARRYWFGQGIGLDGKTRWMLDHEWSGVTVMNSGASDFQETIH